jgi:ectoine hydroxylase-related dioxygenase (phytanoyl-CoA dioxygenase family)
LEPSDPRAPLSELRERFHAAGYLWLKGVLDRGEVLDFRRRVFEAFAEAGGLAPGTDAIDGVPAEDPRGAAGLIPEVARWARFDAFCLARPIVEFYEAFFGEPVMLYSRKIIRVTRPGDPNCTGAHYDLTYLRGAAPMVCTSWLPIGDVPARMGGLVYLEGSDAFGRKMEADFIARNPDMPPEERISAYNRDMAAGGWVTKDLPALAEQTDARWLAADYEAGDMVVHSAYMIHAATMNEDPGRRMRLSADIRYQPVRAKADERWSNHWSPGDGL